MLYIVVVAVLLFAVVGIIGQLLPYLFLIGGVAVIWFFFWYDSRDQHPQAYKPPAAKKVPARRKSSSRRYGPRLRMRRSPPQTGPKRKGARTAFEKAMYPKPRRRKW